MRNYFGYLSPPSANQYKNSTAPVKAVHHASSDDVYLDTETICKIVISSSDVTPFKNSGVTSHVKDIKAVTLSPTVTSKKSAEILKQEILKADIDIPELHLSSSPEPLNLFS